MLYYNTSYQIILDHIIAYYTIAYYTILYYTIPLYCILYYTILYYTILYYTILYHIIFYFVISYHIHMYWCIIWYISFLPGSLQLTFGGRYQVQQQVRLQILSYLMDFDVHWFKTSLQTSFKKDQENLASHGGTLTFWFFNFWQCLRAVSLNLFQFKDFMIQLCSQWIPSGKLT